MHSNFSRKVSWVDMPRNHKSDSTHQLAVLATETLHALASVAAVSIKTTPLVQTWVVFTLINILFAVHSYVPRTNRSVTQIWPKKK